jgi:hypothetical protein
LNGSSVVLLGAAVPLALRSLVATAQEQSKVTPAALLQAMERAFGDARDAVFAVDAAWSKLLPSVVQSGRELDALQDRAPSKRRRLTSSLTWIDCESLSTQSSKLARP